MKKNVWVQRLGVKEIVIFSFKRIFSNVIIYYDKDRIPRAADVILTLLKRCCLCTNFYPIGLKGDKKDSNGCTLFYRIYQDTEICAEKFNQEYLKDEPRWFKKMVAAYLSRWPSNPFYFIIMVKEEIKQFKDTKNIVYVTGYPASSLAVKFYSKEDFEVRQIFSTREHAGLFIKPFYIILKVLISTLMHKKIKTNIKKIKPSIWVEHEGMRTMLSFWRDFVKAQEFDLVYYFDKPDIGVSKENINKCKTDGFKWIDCKKLSDIARLSINDLRETLPLLLKYDTKHPAFILTVYGFGYRFIGKKDV